MEMTYKHDDFDSLTPPQQRAALARFLKERKAHEKRVRDTMRLVAAFVRANPSAVIEITLHSDVLRPGQIPRAVLHVEMDADRFQQVTKFGQE
jgi:hypothetical protein